MAEAAARLVEAKRPHGGPDETVSGVVLGDHLKVPSSATSDTAACVLGDRPLDSGVAAAVEPGRAVLKAYLDGWTAGLSEKRLPPGNT